MGYITNNYFPLSTTSTTQPHLPTHSDDNGSDHHQFITASSSNTVITAVTSRWNPTPEQITTLEEIYKSGTRTPTTEQIKNIASKLRKYGRIEGKNVFYWFQNHKARERLKRRRNEGCSISNKPHNKDNVMDSSSGDHGVDQTKICPSFPLTNPQQQDELVPASYNEDNNTNNKDHGTTEETERASEVGKDATWSNLVTWSITQEPPREIINMDENVNEETKEIQTLNLFPVMKNQEKTVRFIEKTKVNQVCCNYCYYYEFMPLKN